MKTDWIKNTIPRDIMERTEWKRASVRISPDQVSDIINWIKIHMGKYDVDYKLSYSVTGNTVTIYAKNDNNMSLFMLRWS